MAPNRRSVYINLHPAPASSPLVTSASPFLASLSAGEPRHRQHTTLFGDEARREAPVPWLSVVVARDVRAQALPLHREAAAAEDQDHPRPGAGDHQDGGTALPRARSAAHREALPERLRRGGVHRGRVLVPAASGLARLVGTRRGARRRRRVGDRVEGEGGARDVVG